MCVDPRGYMSSGVAQFVLKLAKLSHIIGARGSQDLRSSSPIMAPNNCPCAFISERVVVSCELL